MRRGDFFFFQAEDGIRDPLVTGVQTCALPISFARCRGDSGSFGDLSSLNLPGIERMRVSTRSDAARPPIHFLTGLRPVEWGFRSEERRVGKEWRCGGSTSQRKNTERDLGEPCDEAIFFFFKQKTAYEIHS